MIRAAIAAAIIVIAPAAKADVQRDCIARAIYWEARGTSEAGQRAVAEVIWNRVRHPAFPKTPCAVVYQRIRGVCQFTWACTQARYTTPPNNASWAAAKRIAAQPVGCLTNGALYFREKSRRWRHLEQVAEIDNHVFYSNRR